MKQFCLTLDDKTNARISKYAEEHGIPKSVVIRMIVNDFFLKGGTA